MSDQLNPGDSLNPGQSLTSENNQYTLTLGTDGDITLMKVGNSQPMWSSGSKGVIKLLMQEDGNLVGYDSGGHPLWATGTWGNSGAWCEVANEGRVVVSKVLWGVGG